MCSIRPVSHRCRTPLHHAIIADCARVHLSHRPEAPDAPRFVEIVLPLHQRIRLLQSAHACSVSEARRKLFAVAEESPPSGWSHHHAQPSSISESSPLPSSSSSGQSATSSCAMESTGGARTLRGSKLIVKQPGVYAGSLAAASANSLAAGLLGTCGDGRRVVICTPKSGIREMRFNHIWQVRSDMLAVKPHLTTSFQPTPPPSAMRSRLVCKGGARLATEDLRRGGAATHS